jgi:outer membrane protein
MERHDRLPASRGTGFQPVRDGAHPNGTVFNKSARAQRSSSSNGETVACGGTRIVGSRFHARVKNPCHVSAASVGTGNSWKRGLMTGIWRRRAVRNGNGASNRHARLWWACAIALCAGCVNQKKEMASYRKLLEGPKPPTVLVDYPRGQELTLEAALLLANTGSEQLGFQGEAYLQSLIARDRAYSAFIPTISLAPTFSYQNRPLNHGSSLISTSGGTSGTGVGTTTGTGTGTGTGSGVSSTGTTAAHSYTALDLPLNAKLSVSPVRDVAAVEGAKFNINAQRDTLLNLQASVLLETAQTYYNTLLAERSVEVLSNTADYQDARVADMKNRLKAGIAQPLDVAQSEAQAAATRALLITAQNSVRTNRAMLVFLTNANVREAKLVDRLKVPDSLLPMSEALRIARASRLDIAAATETVTVQQRNVQAALGEYFPSVTLNLDYYLYRQTFPTNVEWAGLLTANFPIFSGGTIEADVRDAWSLYRQAIYSEWQVIRQVRQNVETDWDNLDASRARIHELQAEVDASQTALTQANERYGVGLAINLDVLNAESALLSSQLDLATEEFDYKIFYLDLLRDIGKLPLPANINSMASGGVEHPTTEQIAPMAPINSSERGQGRGDRGQGEEKKRAPTIPAGSP